MVSIYALSPMHLSKPPSRKSSPWSQVPGNRFLECVLQRLEILVRLYVKVLALNFALTCTYLIKAIDAYKKASMYVWFI